MKKKVLSIFLAAVMMLSCFAAALPVFAADNAATVKELIEKFNGDMTQAEPKAEDLAAYSSMINAFNALSKDDIDSFDVVSFDKLLLAVYDREIALWKIENDSTSTANASKAAHERAAKAITMPAYVGEAEALATEANAIKTQDDADAFLSKLAGASKNAAILAGGYYTSYKLFRNSIAKTYGAELFDLAAENISSVTQKADSANKPTSPKYVSYPSPSKYPGGESDPDYIEAFKKYLAYREATADYNVARYAFESEKHYLSALKSLVEACPDFAYLYDITKASIEAKRSFNENGDTAKIAEVVNMYNALGDNEKVWLGAVDEYMFAEKTVASVSDLGIEYTYENYDAADLLNYCRSMEFYYTVSDFEKVVASVTEPYTNADIAKVKEAYEAIPSAIRSAVKADTMDKYNKILAAVGPDEAEDNEPDTGAYKVTDTAKYISERDAEILADATIELVLRAAGVSDTKELVSTKIFTSKAIGAIAGWLYPTLGNLSSLLKTTPSKLARNLSEEKFAGAVEALKLADDDWTALELQNGDFGFEDGDVEGFLDAAAAMLRGASLIHVALKLENRKSTSSGTYTYGAYEEFIEIFELLDLRSVMSSADYTDYVENASNKNDAKVRALLAPIAYLIEDFGNDPINTICDVLPKAAYAIDSGIVNTRINKVLSMMTLVKVAPVDLTTDGIYGILDEKLLTPQSIELSKEKFSSLISALAGCGNAVVKASVQRGQKYRMGIESDRAKSIVVIISWLLDTSADNKALVNSIIDKFLGDNAFLRAALKLAVTASATYIPKKVLFMLVTLFINLANVFTSFMEILK